MVSTVAVIGSFRQHYEHVLDAWRTFTGVGLVVTSPLGSSIIAEGIPFVRFDSDPPDWDDPLVQTVALHRILRADFVYVVAPGGYVGRTTCYEIGRVIQAGRPMYLSDVPQDLPIRLPVGFIRSSDSIAASIRKDEFSPSQCFGSNVGYYSKLENELINGQFRKDDEFA